MCVGVIVHRNIQLIIVSSKIGKSSKENVSLYSILTKLYPMLYLYFYVINKNVTKLFCVVGFVCTLGISPSDLYKMLQNPYFQWSNLCEEQFLLYSWCQEKCFMSYMKKMINSVFPIMQKSVYSVIPWITQRKFA